MPTPPPVPALPHLERPGIQGRRHQQHLRGCRSTSLPSSPGCSLCPLPFRSHSTPPLIPSSLARCSPLVIAMTTSSCLAGSLFRSRGGAVRWGKERRSQRRCLLQVPGCLGAHPILQEGGGLSGDAACLAPAAAAAASTADTLEELEGWFLFALSPARDWRKKKKNPGDRC